MGMIVCPYCQTEVGINDVESEDGCCPECGATIMAGSLFSEDSGMDPLEEELDIDEEDIEDFDEEELEGF